MSSRGLVLLGSLLALSFAPAYARQAEPLPQETAPPADHAAHTAAPAAADDTAASERNLFQSDMWLMAGMTPRDPMAGMAMPGWSWMSLGTVRLAYNRQGGPSGGEVGESSNWTMVMGQRDVAGGRLTLMMMNSAEPATLTGGASPQLFQTGETLDGRPLVDRQHPHDLFMNLSATYRRPIGAEGAWWVQGALRGEPALGPTTYMHRASAGENPAAILGHHNQDSTHITDSVFTVGGGWRWLTVEASTFRGREPDEGRWDIDTGAPDSVSGRVKVRLENGWSGQVSYGFLKEPEALEEGDTRRTTASLHYGEEGDRPLAASFVWGRNREEHGTFHALLAEGAYQWTPRDHLYARAEQVDRDPELLLTKDLHPQEGEEEETVAVRAFTVGYLRDFAVFRDVRWLDQVNVGLGADVTLYAFPSRLEPAYGENPVSAHVFFRLRWGVPHGAGSAHHHMARAGAPVR